MIKPIETVYNGYRFRSRLEARWAVFFDALGVRYEYELDGFDLGELGWYLPDFFLPEHQCWVEIKGTQASGEEAERCHRLSAKAKAPVILLEGIPGINPLGDGWFSPSHRTLVFLGEAWDTWYPTMFVSAEIRWVIESRFRADRLPLFLADKFPNESIHLKDCETSTSRKRLIDLDTQYYTAKYGTKDHPIYRWGRLVKEASLDFHKDSGGLFIGYPSILYPWTCDALLAARQARFEHGETPQVPE